MRRCGPRLALERCVYALAPLAIVALSTLSTACAPYRAGSFHTGVERFPSARSTRGCVDIAIRAALDPHAEGPVLDLYLGNRCDEGVWVDIPAVEVTAHLANGEDMAVGLYDPRNELKPAVLGGRELVMERIETEAPVDTLSVCANLEQLTSAATAGPPQVLCTTVLGGA